MQIKKTIKCPVCGMNYIEGAYSDCPKCSGVKIGYTRELINLEEDKGKKDLEDVVCGWLICTKGAFKGGYFKLTNSKNRIGGGEDNSVVLDFDEDIDKMTSCLVVFDDLLNCFWAMNGCGKNCIKINNDLLISPLKIKTGDILKIGNTELTFIPLFNENFKWENFK